MTTTHANGHAASPVTYDVRHVTTYTYSEPVPVCHNEIHLVPRWLPRQRLLTNDVAVDPSPTAIFHHTDFFGNPVGFFSIEQGHEQLVVTAKSRVEVAAAPSWRELPRVAWEEVRDRLVADPGPEPLAARQFCYESPLVRRSPLLAEWTRTSFAKGRPWAEALVDLTTRINREFTYDPTATTTSTPVEEVFHLRRGVCQDFAHLQIACLRSIGLAARYVSGYIANGPRPDGTEMVGADASHAWLSCWGGGSGWLDVDPTNDCLPDRDHITLGWGRDYGDVCPIKGVYVGGGRHGMDVAVHVLRLPAAAAYE